MTTRIFTAARVHTLSSPLTPGANAIAVEHGRIRMIAAIDLLRARFPDAEIMDLGGATITPGLTDAHIHITEWAIARQQIDLAEAHDVNACLRLIARHGPSGEEWLTGRGWNPHHWGGSYPDRHQLDAVTVSRPAALQSHDMHALWVNSRALQVAGIGRHTPDPAGGRIVRDAAGDPTGVLLETAAQLVVQRIPRSTDAQVRTAVRQAQGELHGYGITGIHSFPPIHMPEPDASVVLQALLTAGELRLRVLQHIALDKLDHALATGLRSGSGDDWIRTGGVKMFLDGALGSRTAWMREPYESGQDCGVQVLAETGFRDNVNRAAAGGLASVVHAIGDAAVGMAFDVLSAAPRLPALPHRIEHVQCFPRDRTALLRHGIICSVQPCHLMTDWPAAERHWGARSADAYAFRTLLEGGAILAFGSDAPVEPADPRLGFYAAVARQDRQHQPDSGWHAEQRIMMSDALAGYTTGPAVAAGALHVQGQLSSGAYADFAVWSADPLSSEPAALLDLTIAATVINGEVVFEA